ncbi:hypothetical protein IO424_000652 [Campylobacter fetus]|uniref:hypothetical protein n=1 Tax=Campylobacter fetus TaxID=196 RepID=UPI00050921B1|nr:hypothetical protein [Campylobacter fetus]WKW17296.1 hypothetical protein IXZ25_09040 [Campylobacter fetus subsp. fetus]AIR79556.1 hypothetical protein CFF04554_1707 [Campylobacter fetus subsp. fetus 04/554]EAJ5694198.1 hypothetical protein [Campylobacter fetus]EAJ5703684.1 hypothetical protein [Campylobacter fetus]EAJ9256879.1 hypothetical protein [Campylobacter fetus]
MNYKPINDMIDFRNKHKDAFNDFIATFGGCFIYVPKFKSVVSPECKDYARELYENIYKSKVADKELKKKDAIKEIQRIILKEYNISVSFRYLFNAINPKYEQQ